MCACACAMLQYLCIGHWYWFFLSSFFEIGSVVLQASWPVASKVSPVSNSCLKVRTLEFETCASCFVGFEDWNSGLHICTEVLSIKSSLDAELCF